MSYLSLLKERWGKAKLPVIFYHTAFIENASLILKNQRIVANKGKPICEGKMGWYLYQTD